ncbi:AAA family ATPase [Anderseniella sp. Alg231-50]|uniref:AAA family ATPase n=1 Tax=Anderseniella sp. Alg231-50 TaxID=1922226 RepID=UPI000D55423F
MTWTDIRSDLANAGYIASDELAMAVHLAQSLGRPLLLEGAAGVGKTQIAKTLADVLDTRLIRLQCYEGLDAATSIYEWNYQRQLLSIRAAADEGAASSEIEDRIFSEKYLLKRPLLEAIQQDVSPVLLIDEIDRADEEFEAYLLELLSDFQISIPELGTIAATTRPHVVLTANGTRDLSDALRRRCIYSFVDYPDKKTELVILKAHFSQLNGHLAEQIVGFVQALRKEDLEKKPGVAELLDWTAAVSGLGINDLSDDPATLQATLVCLLKTQADQAAVPPEVAQRLVGKAA